MIDRSRIAELLHEEQARFVDLHPQSLAAHRDASNSLLGGVPMPWMTRWPGRFPITVERAEHARLFDLDGLEYIDFCLGDTGAMTGHAIAEITEKISHQLGTGSTTMLPSNDATWVSQELSRRFAMSKWQFAISATDANRFALRLARHMTGRPRILVHDWCYHGTVDETLVIADEKGNTISRPGAVGPQVDPALTTRVVPFNDLERLEAALRCGDVACMIIEPALTNIGIVLPEPGYLQGVRDLTKKYGTLLIIDETHTICAGPGGCTALWNLSPDILVIGKTIGGGIPVGAYGLTDELGESIADSLMGHDVDVSGVGGTLAGSALAMAAVRATLTSALLPYQFEKTTKLATLWTNGVQETINSQGLDWSVQQLGCRAEYWYCQPPKNGREAAAAIDGELESLMHIWALNRGILLTPFHNMALFSPYHTIEDVKLHTKVFAEVISALTN